MPRFIASLLPALQPGQPEPYAIVMQGGVTGRSKAEAMARAQTEMRDVLADLLEWETQTGGWEAPVWKRARALLNRVRRLEEG